MFALGISFPVATFLTCHSPIGKSSPMVVKVTSLAFSPIVYHRKTVTATAIFPTCRYFTFCLKMGCAQSGNILFFCISLRLSNKLTFSVVFTSSHNFLLSIVSCKIFTTLVSGMSGVPSAKASKKTSIPFDDSFRTSFAADLYTFFMASWALLISSKHSAIWSFTSAVISLA